MFEGYSAETCARNIPLVPMGGGAEGPACADTGARTPIGASGIYHSDIFMGVGRIFLIGRKVWVL